MFPPQTSLIGVTVALTRFLETNSLVSFNLNYPYWYLGTTPFKFLTGPVVPLLVSLAHKLLSNATLFSITIYLILLSYLASVFGWVWLVKKLSKTPNLQILILGVLVLIFPWRLFSALAFDEASVTIARNFLPFVLLGVWNLLGNKSLKNWTVALATTILLLLVSTQVLLPLVVGAVALVLAKKTGQHTKTGFKLLVLSFAFATAWYSPGYWMVIAFNPSVGGVSGGEAAINVVNFLKASLPIFLAVFAVYFWAKLKDRLSVFTFVWLVTFFPLTAFRFLANPYFWIDWASWVGEMEVGIALLLAGNSHLNSKRLITYSLLLITFTLPFLVTFYVWRMMGKPALISSRPPSILQSLAKLNEVAGNSRVFVSGSTVFWLNAFYDTTQVRGGVDQAAVDSSWYKAAYELREGESPEKSLGWLKKLDVKYVLVHTASSKEYYHDFKHVEKWDKVGKKLWEKEGDIIYQIKD